MSAPHRPPVRHPRQRRGARGGPGRHRAPDARPAGHPRATSSSTDRARPRSSSAVMDLEAAGALVIAGNTDIAVADGDYAAAFPWLDEVPVGPARCGRVGPRAAQPERQLDYLRRLPAERRLRVGEDARAGLPRLAGQPDGGPAGRPRCRGHDAARHAHRRARHLLRSHPRGRRARAGPQAHRQPGLLRLRLRRQPGRLLGAAHAGRWRRAGGTAHARGLRRPGGRRRRSASAGCPRTSTALPPSAPGGSCDEPGRRRAPRGRDRPGRGHAPGHRRAHLLAAPRGGRRRACGPSPTSTPPGCPAASPARCPTSTRAWCSTARRCAATTAPPRWPSWPPTRRSTTPACRDAWKASWPRRRASSWAPAWAARARSSSRSPCRPRGAASRLSPFFIPMAIANMASGVAAMTFGALGPNFSPTSACASAGHAIGEAAEMIRRGDAEVMLAGGCEASVYAATVGGFAAMRALSTRNDDPPGASRPFDAGRDGFVVAEGAATLVLEELGHARRRGARIHAELCGYGATADAHHITSPAPGGAGAVRAARRALQKAGFGAERIDLVSAHATSTGEGDPAELMAINTLVGERAAQVSVTATKSSIGHTLGAAGALAVVATIMALQEGVVPPTLNLVDPDAARRRPRPDPAAGAPPARRRGARQRLRLRRPERRHHPAALGRLSEPSGARSRAWSPSSTAWRRCWSVRRSRSSRSRRAAPPSSCERRRPSPRPRRCPEPHVEETAARGARGPTMSRRGRGVPTPSWHRSRASSTARPRPAPSPTCGRAARSTPGRSSASSRP